MNFLSPRADDSLLFGLGGGGLVQAQGEGRMEGKGRGVKTKRPKKRSCKQAS